MGEHINFMKWLEIRSHLPKKAVKIVGFDVLCQIHF